MSVFSNTDNKDFIRHKIFKYLELRQLTINKKYYIKFYKFINNDEQYEVLDTYLQVLVGMYNEKKSKEILDNLLDEYKNYIKLYSFKELYKIDEEWYDFYKENTNKNGIKNNNERRKGVKKKYVDDIMIIKKLIELNNGMNLTLEESMIFYENLKLSFFNTIGFL
jgi:hypothetical protein